MVRNRAFQSYKERSEPRFDSNVQNVDYIQPGGWKTLFSSCLLLRNWDFLLGSSLYKKKKRTRPEKMNYSGSGTCVRRHRFYFLMLVVMNEEHWKLLFSWKKKKEWIMMLTGRYKNVHIVFWGEINTVEVRFGSTKFILPIIYNKICVYTNFSHFYFFLYFTILCYIHFISLMSQKHKNIIPLQ